MMTLRLEPNAYELTRYFDVPPTRIRLDRKTLAAVAMVGAAFTVLGLYFATQTFVSIIKADPDGPTIEINPVKIPPPPPPRTRTEPTPTPPMEPVESVRPVDNPPVTPPQTTTVLASADPIDTGPIATTPAATVGPATTTPTVAPSTRSIPTVLRPDWLRQPSAADINRLFPDRAARLGREGTAILNCTVARAGTLSGCTVAAETPTGYGFGRAALEMVPLFRMRPLSIDGMPVDGQRLNIPVRFKLG